MGAEIPTRPNSHGSDSRGDPNALPAQMAKLLSTASLLLEKAENSSDVSQLASAVDKASTALKLAADIDRAQTEIAKVTQETSKLERENLYAQRRERSEQIRDYVALLTPLVTIITLAATLVAQNWQFLRSEKDKREQAQDEQWHDAVKTISSSGSLSPGVIALQPFLRSAKYGDHARDVAVNLLATNSDPAFFNSLFGTALTPVTWANVDRVLRLDRALQARGSAIWGRAYDPKLKDDNPQNLDKAERPTYDYLQVAIPIVSAEIANVLKTPRPQGVPLDLSATYLKRCDLSGANFDDANLENARIGYSILKDAELGQVAKFNGAQMWSTAWWQAKSISRPFFEYLKSNAAFMPGKYAAQEVTQEQYEAAVGRLAAQWKSSNRSAEPGL
jgi:hypothetical protein